MRGQYRILAFLSLILIGVGALIWLPHAPAADPAAAPELPIAYAAPVEHVETHVLKAGETLGGVLARASVDSHNLPDLLLALREYVSPRRLAPGVEVTVRRWAGGSATRSVDIRVNPDTTVRLQPGGLGWSGTLLLTPVVVDTVYAAGRIESGRTLYEAIVDDEDSTLPVSERTQLVGDLADIYSFKIDFTREIKAGDSYRLVYEREARPDGTARHRRILAAEIVNQGKPYYAIYFASDKGAGYYDRESRSLRHGFSRYPVAFLRITSNFSRRRYQPILGIYRPHLGTDFGAPTGTPVHATADGTVLRAGWDGGYGNMIELRHTNGYSTRYGHLSRFAKGIHRGVKVKQSQVIGYVGQTGLATGPHLHYELRLNGRAIDARKAHLPEAPPISAEYRDAFFASAEARLALLGRVAPPPVRVAEAQTPVTDQNGGGM